jgi:hypothetical protein
MALMKKPIFVGALVLVLLACAGCGGTSPSSAPATVSDQQRDKALDKMIQGSAESEWPGYDKNGYECAYRDTDINNLCPDDLEGIGGGSDGGSSAAPSETVSAENARETAQSYLESQSFSRSGLIDQLKYEGFSVADATYAVGVVAYAGIWNEQAVKTAQSYLDNQSFSRSGLIEQLEYEGFTPSQAVYGVNSTGL